MAATTPIRDVLRGRFLSGRLDVDRIVAEGDLPDPLPDLILRVVRRTRLWRLERADVARELVEHFRDDLEGGSSPTRTAQAFGDPDRAALQIRRSRIRNRRASSRLIERVIAQSGLPESLSELIHRVVRRTRLWRHERADVARELVAHLCDGLEQGRSVEHLIDSFGDERVAARLIRRGTKRKRPIAWRAARRTVQTTGAFVALMLVMYLALALRYYTGRPKISHDYLAQLNAPIRAIPESQRAWPIYRQAYLDLEVVPDEILKGGWYDPAALRDPAQRARVSAYLARNTEAIALIRRAASMPHMGKVLSHEPDAELMARDAPEGYEAPTAAPESLDVSLVSLRLPELGILQEFARVLATDADLAAERDDGATVVADLEALLGAMRHTAEEPLLGADMNGMRIFLIQLNALGAILADKPNLLTDAQLIALSHRISAQRREGRVAASLRSLQMIFEDIVQRVYTDDGRGNGRLRASGMATVRASMGVPEPDGSVEWFKMTLLPPIVSVASADRRSALSSYNRFVDRAIARSQMPQWKWTSALDNQKMLDDMQRVWFGAAKAMMVYWSMPIEYYILASEEITQRRDAMLVVLALEIYRRRHGEYPDSLDDLVPDLLPAVPPDRFTGEAIGYRRTRDRAVVYSVGADRDDDGGVPPPGKDGNTLASIWRAPDSSGDDRPIPDGDWILWPPIIPESRAGVGVQTGRSDD